MSDRGVRAITHSPALNCRCPPSPGSRRRLRGEHSAVALVAQAGAIARGDLGSGIAEPNFGVERCATASMSTSSGRPDKGLLTYSYACGPSLHVLLSPTQPANLQRLASRPPPSSFTAAPQLRANPRGVSALAPSSCRNCRDARRAETRLRGSRALLGFQPGSDRPVFSLEARRRDS